MSYISLVPADHSVNYTKVQQGFIDREINRQIYPSDGWSEGLSGDKGITWTLVEMGAGLEYIRSLCYLGNGVCLAGAGNTYHSTDYGVTWTLVGAGLEYVRSLCYLGNGVCLAGAGNGVGDGDIYRSTDYGVTWTLVEMGAGLEVIYSLCYLGNGVCLAGAGNSTGDGDIYRSVL